MADVDKSQFRLNADIQQQINRLYQQYKQGTMAKSDYKRAHKTLIQNWYYYNSRLTTVRLYLTCK